LAIIQRSATRCACYCLLIEGVLFAYFAVRVHTSVAAGFTGYVGRQIAQGPTALPASVR